MTRFPTPATRLVALLGDPVHHSLSPQFQNAAIAATGVDAVYLALRCNAAALPGLLVGIARSGGAGNVTVPHKEVAARALERSTEAVVRTGACNTFWLENGKVVGDNTDVVGFSGAVHDLLGQPVEGARVLLIGAGGAARAAAYSLIGDQAGEVVVLNRTADSARDLVARFAPEKTKLRVCDSLDWLRGESFDLVVNATSLGIDDADPLPLPIDAGATMGAAIDLVYKPERTRWVRELRSQNVRATDGLEMLVLQGAAGFELWWGIPAPIEAMRSALSPP